MATKKKMNKRLSKGIRKYIRQEKARIRRQFLRKEEQEKEIKALMEKFH